MTKQLHITYVVSVMDDRSVRVDGGLETEPAFRGTPDIVVDARDIRYFVRLVGRQGRMLTAEVRREAARKAKELLEANPSGAEY
jgi:hypothetical protein